MSLTFEETPFSDLFIVHQKSFNDERGSFARVFCLDTLKEINCNTFTQANHSKTLQKGTFRGLHYQVSPYAEDKLVKCIRGSVFDVAVDMRADSKTYLQWYGIKLTEQDPTMIYIPKGFAHGYQTLAMDSELMYFSTSNYAPEAEKALHYADPKIGLELPLTVTQISKKDQSAPFLET